MASLVEQRFVEEVLTSEGARLLKNQEAAFAARLHFHSGNIVSRRRAETITPEEMSGKLVLTHVAYERFLDMTMRRDGKVIRKSKGTHYRFMYGHFNSIAFRLANDLTEAVRARIRASLNTTQ
jgi:hypothetical protein